MKIICRLIVLFGMLLAIGTLKAQDILMTSDLSKINVDEMSDEEIIRYHDHLLSSGLTEGAAEQLAIRRGMPSTELAKLKERLSRIDKTSKTDVSTTPRRIVDTSLPLSNLPLISEKRQSRVFGSQLFANNLMTFEPNIRIATPKDYVIGPDDELLIDVYGYQETNYRLTVSPEGSITVPYVGVIPVSGVSIERAAQRIKDRMIRNGYASLATGRSKLDVNVGKIKSIKVTIIGEAKRPGTYTLSSLSTMFNALYAAGGITDQGSFRKIELIRNNKIVSELDAYDFLLRGNLSDNSGLVDQDVIRIPVANLQVEVKGEVKTPGIFEMKPLETLTDLIKFSGGFTNRAYTASLRIRQLNDHERQLKDISKTDFDNYRPTRGDVVIVDEILGTFSNRVTINGAVLRPGEFELTPGLTLSQLISKADGLRQDAFSERGQVVRTRADLTKEIIPFNVTEVLRDPFYNFALKKEDVVTIASLFDFKDKYTVTIEGEVRKPGEYSFIDSLTLKDLLFQAGGLTDAAASQQIEIARRVNNDKAVSSNQIAEVVDVNSGRDLEVKGSEIKLSPWDIVIVRAKVGYKPQVAVQLQGEVMYPGTYILESKQERISDVIQRAGGLTADAFLEGVYLTRVNPVSLAKEANLTRIKKIQKDVNDTSNTILNDFSNPTIKVGLNLAKILQNPGSSEDIMLKEGDVLNVSKKSYEVMVNGEVMFPTQVVFKEGADLSYYIDKAGGFTDNARKRKTYVLYANGSAAKTSRFLFFRSYPEIKAGAEILVPKTPERSRSRLTTAEVLGLTSGFATLLTIVVTLVRL